MDGGLDVSDATLLGGRAKSALTCSEHLHLPNPVHGWVVDMSKCLLLLLAVTQCVETAAAAPPQQAETPAAATATRWRAWRAPADTAATRLSPADAALRVEAIRRHAEEHFADREDRRYRAVLEQVWAFPLTGDLLAGRAFWAVLVPGFQSAHRLRTPRRHLDRGDAILGAVLLRHRCRPGGD